ncbi:hypothetical protein [Methylobacterium sp. Leaf399]|uniref:hypothetical protein n=1 Tax=Methylobacterium sp. Leaf399 TaxID=1736364 RepID=UPI0009E6E5E4|nr:hypothetical protein [Methylobacterium sp. Leaf399]
MRGLGSAFVVATAMVLSNCALAQGTAGTGVPANICKELTAFLHPPAPAAPAAAAAPSQTAVQAPNPGGSSPAPSGASETQKSSGLSGPTTNGGPGASGPQGASQNAGSPSGASAPSGQASPPPAQAAAPAAPAAPPPKKPSSEEVVRADAAIAANDIAACQASARGMRRAGVVMPAPLMSLAALDLKFLIAAQ